MALHLPIHHSYGPHVDREFLCASLAMSYVPWKYKRGESVELLRRELTRRLRGDAFLFASGREGLLALLRSLHIQPGDEVIVQGYTCIVVSNAIQAARAVPIYADIERETLNLDIEVVEKAITPRTRAVICQHTFGIPADTRALRELCNQHNLVLIEDCAHTLPDETGPEIIGREGDFLLVSFGRDKAISGVAGGAILSRDASVSHRLRLEDNQAADLPFWRITMLLNYPSIQRTARWFFPLHLGRVFLRCMRLIGFLIPILEHGEKQGKQQGIMHRMPNACAYLALRHLKRLRALNDHRRALAQFYRQESKKRSWQILAGIEDDLPLQKFPMFVKNAQKIREALKEKMIFLDDGWTGCVVCPAHVNLDAANYRFGMDPQAESVCEQILNLPTHPTMTMAQARRLVEELDKLLRMENGKWKMENEGDSADP